jgi:TetR/AcrR family transcriptional regulator, cholesterol catabolism regulator
MPAPPIRRRASRRGEIIDAFTRMVAESGYDAVAIRDLAEALGMSKGTVLHHFGSKDRLLEEVHSTYMRRRLDEAEIILGQLETPEEQLRGMVFQNLIAMQQDAAATRVFAREIVRFSSEDLMRDVRAMRREYFDLLRGILARGMKEGTFRDGNATIVAFQLFGMMNWTWTWFDPEGDVRVEDIARTFLDTILHGLRASSDAGEGRDQEMIEIVRSAIADVARRESENAAPAKAVDG